VGCGAVSEILYARALDTLAGAGVVEALALVDPNPERTANIGKTLPTARQYRSLDQMLAEVTPDLAIIAAPHRLHADLAVACLDRGIHVLCEKPMAVTTADCDRMLAAADKVGCLLAVGYFRRFFLSCQIVKSILEAGLLGAVRSFRFLEGETYSWPAQSASFFNRSEAGGGVLIDAGAHTMDLLLWWLGDVAEVRYQDDAMGGVEANCLLNLTMTSGVKGVVQLSRDWPLPNRYVIECEKGWLAYICDVVDRIEWGLRDSEYGLNAQIRTMAATTGARMRDLGPAALGFMDCFVSQLRNVVAAIRGAEPLRVPGTEARKSVALIERCYQSRRLLDMPWLDEVEVERAQELANV
jgi:predicted dehydrogenase